MSKVLGATLIVGAVAFGLHLQLQISHLQLAIQSPKGPVFSVKPDDLTGGPALSADYDAVALLPDWEGTALSRAAPEVLKVHGTSSDPDQSGYRSKGAKRITSINEKTGSDAPFISADDISVYAESRFEPRNIGPVIRPDEIYAGYGADIEPRNIGKLMSPDAPEYN